MSRPIGSKNKPKIQNLEDKAFNQDVSTNFWQFFFGQSSNKYYSPKQLLAYNTGWIAACLNKNAQTLSSIPIKLYYKKASNQVLKASKYLPVKKDIQQFIKGSYKKSFAELVEIPEHPVLELLQHPNDRMNWTDLVILSESYMGLIGNAYLYKEKNKEGDVEKIYPLLSENVSAMVKENDFGYGKITGYKYSKDDTAKNNSDKAIIFPAEDIIHLLNVSPGNNLYGRGELEQCLCCAERELYYDQVENYLNRNNARPDFLISYTNGIKENEQKELMRMWYKKYGTPQNSGKPMIAGGDVKVQQLGFTPRDMQYKSGRDQIRMEICSVFGVPEALLVINESNFASSKSATDHYIQFTIKPKLTRLLEKLNEQLVSLYDPNLFLWWDGEFNSSFDKLEQAQVDQIYLTNGVYTPHYIQDRMGIEGITNDTQASPTGSDNSDKPNNEVVANE